MVRLHLAGDAPSVEGIFVGFWAGHYVLRVASVVSGADKTHELDGPEARIPREKVLIVQVIQ